MATLSKPKRQYRRIQRPKMKICIWCGTEYQAIRSDSLYCSASCTTLASIERLRNAKPEEYEARLKKNAQKAKEKRYEQIEIEQRMKLAEEEKLKQEIEAQKRKEQQLKLSQKQAEEHRLRELDAQKAYYTSPEYQSSWKESMLKGFSSSIPSLNAKIAAEESKVADYFDEDGYVFDNYKGTYTIKLNQINKWKAQLAEIETNSQPDKLHSLFEKHIEDIMFKLRNGMRL